MRSAAFGCMAHCCATPFAARLSFRLMSEIKTQSTKPLTRGEKREIEKVGEGEREKDSESLLLMPQRKDLTDGGN